MLEVNEHIINDTDTISHYQLQRLLARGGMSHVYLAYDTETHHIVAIKLVHSDEGDFCKRFQREVKAIAKLHHDHILPAFDYGEEGEWCYMVMPYIDGGTLKQRLEQGPLPAEEVEKLFTQLTSAVQFAHDNGILHRDIKPSNILLRDGEHIYLTDFGLVRHIEEESNITGTGYVIGTPEYMAPEQVEHASTTSSDVYALGIVLYQMLTGRVPFKGSSPIGTCWKHIHEQPTPPSMFNPAISSETEKVMLRALAKDPQDRFQSAHELSHAFQNSLRTGNLLSANTLTIPVDVMQPKQPVRRISRVHPSMIALVALMMLFIIPTTLGFLLSHTYGYNHYNQAPTLLGASGSFFNGQVSGKPPVHSTPPVKATTVTTTTPTPINTLSRYTSPPVSTPLPGGSSHGGTSQGGSHSGDHTHKGGSGHKSDNGGGNKGNGNGGGNKGNGGDSNNSQQNAVTLS